MQERPPQHSSLYQVHETQTFVVITVISYQNYMEQNPETILVDPIPFSCNLFFPTTVLCERVHAQEHISGSTCWCIQPKQEVKSPVLKWLGSLLKLTLTQQGLCWTSTKTRIPFPLERTYAFLIGLWLLSKQKLKALAQSGSFKGNVEQLSQLCIESVGIYTCFTLHCCSFDY